MAIPTGDWPTATVATTVLRVGEAGFVSITDTELD
jgi:hypothetical protein